MDDIKNLLYDKVKEYIEKQQITCGETIYQTDRVSLTSLEFIEECCDIVGYAEIKD